LAPDYRRPGTELKLGSLLSGQSHTPILLGCPFAAGSFRLRCCKDAGERQGVVDRRPTERQANRSWRKRREGKGNGAGEVRGRCSAPRGCTEIALRPAIAFHRPREPGESPGGRPLSGELPMATGAAAAGSAPAHYNPPRLFILSCLSLATGALVFSLFANIMPALGKAFELNDAELVGIAGSWGIGLAIAVFTGSALLDTVGMKRAIGLACLLQLVGVLVTVFTPNLAGLGGAILVLTIGQIILGLGHGLIEATINPLAATVYPDDKTHRLNVLHAWWPGGLVIGGLLGYGLGKAEQDWRL